MMLCNVAGGMNIADTICCLFDIDFHCLVGIVYVCFLIQFVVVVVVCMYYVAHSDIVAALLIGLSSCLLCFL